MLGNRYRNLMFCCGWFPSSQLIAKCTSVTPHYTRENECCRDRRRIGSNVCTRMFSGKSTLWRIQLQSLLFWATVGVLSSGSMWLLLIKVCVHLYLYAASAIAGVTVIYTPVIFHPGDLPPQRSLPGEL